MQPSLREYRRSASFDGEWSGDVEAVKVGHVTHFVAELGDDESGYDYRLVTAIPAPEGAQEPEPAAWLVTWKGGEHWYCHAHASEMPAVDQARIMGGKCEPLYRAALAAPAPQAPVALTDERIAEAARSAHRFCTRQAPDLRTRADAGRRARPRHPAPKGPRHEARLHQARRGNPGTHQEHRSVSFTRMQVGSVREEAEKLSAAHAPFSTHYKPAWRFIDGRLQALRKAGKIRYQRKPGLVADDQGAHQ